MKISISVPSGYHAREILFPLQSLLTDDPSISSVFVITPAAEWHQQLFPDFASKFSFHPNAFTPEGHEHLLSDLKPDLVLTPTMGLDLKDTPLILAARRLNIPTLTFVSSWDNVFKIARLIRHGHAKHISNVSVAYALPDYFAVWNQYNSDHLFRLLPQLKPAQVVITGPPRFDYFTHTDRIPSKADVYRYLNIKSDPAVTSLVHCATTELYPFNYIIKQIHSAVVSRRLTTPIELYASVHPGGNMSKHQGYAKYGVTTRYSFGRRDSAPHPDFLFLPTTTEMYYLVALFQHSSLLVNQSSTVAIESMRANVPVINVMYGRSLDWWRWRHSMVYRDFNQHYRYITDNKGTSLVKHRRSLLPAINVCLNNPAYKSFERAYTVQEIITNSDGRCGRRLIDLAKSLV
ncbi:MAG: hypothetical protein A3G57_02485 [Candidatus Andersenbacteria bacterium RIFCSPLOWO2_12_FULL_45_8]|nr:MAG: hypothetical protein UW94_C0003G0094 [Parcubacteria group bacterium GW2011_GWA2_45_14]OGY33749.1 MAG: hypothetical protein A3B76_02720 [Candidatus Andersenbacteria bacterium RIFCSPHIGHO2_02_FULL_46_16]OGY36184.1 MAG: hypothetical protein A3I08_05040 [Candidatus Andersenbacteria bacterium RIFCSPLOWO2_02_FULL_46_11]OGY39191.1 MAG: hypothetical protein A3G57_02485 [Candidatus Andersenbacteria bacterium RIFCSPLOWO2_12_FULL_45_8]HBE89837.1 hypothetical protein [Candidatus Andersenbacteria ba